MKSKSSIILLLLLALLFLHCSPVSTVIDGDTIKLTDNETVRYLGIDTPEKGELYYYEAKNGNARLLNWRAISFESDVTDKDKYGRLLRYVFADKIFVNVELVRQGYAFVYRQGKFPDQKYYRVLKEAADEACAKKLGIWGMNYQHPKLRYIQDYYIPVSYNR